MSTETQQQIEQVEMSMEEAKRIIETGDAIKRLYDNEDFKKVILDGYFKDEAARVVGLRADANMMGENEQKMIDTIITSIGGLRQYFLARMRMAESAKMALEQDQETHAELLREDVQGEA